MIPTRLPAASPISSGATQAATASGAQAAPADFLLMLGQLVGAGAPAPSAAGQPQLRKLLIETEGSAEERDASDVLGLLPISLPVMTQEIAAAMSTADKPDLIFELQLSRGSGRTAVSIDSQMLKDLGAALSATSGDGQATFDSALSPHASTEAQQPTRAAANPESMLSRPVHTPVGSGAWADEIGSRLTMMAEQGRHTASLRLSPEHLGPLEIRIAIRDDQASVWFGAAHADTRAAIEHALPRLRELFESQGMSLADAGVFREPPREQAGDTNHSDGLHDSQSDDASSSSNVNLKLGLIDAYA
ncbi:MAG: flagellar hook-length control protein FliK [Steroidobacter sp.]